MAHRSPAFVLVLALTALLAAPSHAIAQEDESAEPPRAPLSAPTVVGPLPSGARLVAFDDDRNGASRLCTEVVRARRALFAQTTCSPAPRSVRSPVLQSTSDSEAERPTTVAHYGVVVPSVTAMELVFANGGVARASTSAGEEYTGVEAGRVRFFFVETGVGRVRAVRSLGADGRVLAVQALSGDRTVASATIARSRDRRVTVELQDRIRPLPDDPNHQEPAICVSFRSPAGSRGSCANPDLRGDLLAGVSVMCRGSAVYGLVSARVTTVTAVLGDGRSVRLALERLPAAFGSARALARQFSPRTAIRRLVARTASGAVLQEVLLRAAPGVSACHTAEGLLVAFGAREPDARRLPAGPPRLIAADRGAELCFAISRPDPAGRDCALPPVDIRESRIEVLRNARQGAIAIVVPQEVAAVEVTFVGSAPREVPTVRADGIYAGRYREHVRFALVTFPARSKLAGVRLVRAGGRGITDLGHVDPRPVVRRRRLIGGPFAAYSAIGPSGTCLAFGRRPTTEAECDGSSGLRLEADCAQRRIVVYGGVPLATRSLRAVLGDGRVLAARIALSPRQGRAGKRAAVLVLPRATGLRRLELVTARRRTRRLAVPPVTEQCGYEVFTRLGAAESAR